MISRIDDGFTREGNDRRRVNWRTTSPEREPSPKVAPGETPPEASRRDPCPGKALADGDTRTRQIGAASITKCADWG